MNKYNPNIHHRRSIRLKGYDYSQAGLYYVTICVKDRKCLYGKIENHTMILNDAGKMVEKWFNELPNKFNDIKCHEMVVMLNHFHCIIENTGIASNNGTTVGADLRVCPIKTIVQPILNYHSILVEQSEICSSRSGNHILGEPDEYILGEPDEHILGEPDEHILGEPDEHILGEPDEYILGEPDEYILGELGSPLHRVIQWFKTMSTNEYIRGVKTLNWQPFNGKLWQRNYYEHIIQNEKSYQRIANYIINNPAKWNDDKFYNK